MPRLTSASLVGCVFATPALAHAMSGDPSQGPGWTLDPWIVVPLLLSLALFALGWRKLSTRSNQRTRFRRQAALFGGGCAVLVIALISPLHQLGEQSFAAHMFEHELIMLAAAPLLVAAEPLTILLWAFPADTRQRIGGWVNAPAIKRSWRSLTAPVTATLIQAAALWLWHAPGLFDIALASNRWHVVQHLSFLIGALLFWTALLSPRTPPAVAVVCLVATSVVSGALGALMAFANSPWYAPYARLGMTPYGLTPAEDQQLAGLLMWIPGGLIDACAALLVLRRVLRPARA